MKSVQDQADARFLIADQTSRRKAGLGYLDGRVALGDHVFKRIVEGQKPLDPSTLSFHPVDER
jgi:hypothetical protein